MRKNSEEKPIDIISMEEYLKKRQVVRQRRRSGRAGEKNLPVH